MFRTSFLFLLGVTFLTFFLHPKLLIEQPTDMALSSMTRHVAKKVLAVETAEVRFH